MQYKVFSGVRIHGIVLQKGDTEKDDITGEIGCTAKILQKLAVFGERKVAVLSLNATLEALEVAESGSIKGLNSQLQAEKRSWHLKDHTVTVLHNLARLSHWVLDAIFLEVRINML